jgi:hypothetical protein
MSSDSASGWRESGRRENARGFARCCSCDSWLMARSHFPATLVLPAADIVESVLAYLRSRRQRTNAADQHGGAALQVVEDERALGRKSQARYATTARFATVDDAARGIPAADLARVSDSSCGSTRCAVSHGRWRPGVAVVRDVAAFHGGPPSILEVSWPALGPAGFPNGTGTGTPSTSTSVWCGYAPSPCGPSGCTMKFGMVRKPFRRRNQKPDRSERMPSAHGIPASSAIEAGSRFPGVGTAVPGMPPAFLVAESIVHQRHRGERGDKARQGDDAGGGDDLSSRRMAGFSPVTKNYS